MFSPPPPPPPLPPVPFSSPPEPLAPGRRRPPTANHTWAWVYAAIGGVLVAGYFFLASLVAVVTLDGDPSVEQEILSERLWSAAAATLVLAPVGAWVTHLAVRWAGDRDQSGSALVAIIIGWLLSFGAAWALIDVLPSDDRAVGFGVIWAVGGFVVCPAVAVAVAYAGTCRSRNRFASR